jgi:hypothetical protein
MPNNIIDMRNQTFLSLLLLPVILLCCVSCKKGVEDIRTKVYGTLYDYYTGNPIAGAEVKVLSFDNQSPDYSDTIKATTSNSNGEYEITFYGRRDNNISYHLFIHKQPEGYLESDRQFEIRKKHSNLFNFNLKGNAYLKVHIKNQTPYNNDDLIQLWAGIFQASQVGNFVGQGTNVDTNVLFSTKGTGSRFVWLGGYITKNNIPKEFEDSIYCNSLDTAYYSLLY